MKTIIKEIAMVLLNHCDGCCCDNEEERIRIATEIVQHFRITGLTQENYDSLLGVCKCGRFIVKR